MSGENFSGCGTDSNESFGTAVCANSGAASNVSIRTRMTTPSLGCQPAYAGFGVKVKAEALAICGVSPALELHHHAEAELGLASAKVWEPDRSRSAAGRVSRGKIRCSGCRARVTSEILREAIITTRRRHAAAAGEIRNVGVAIASLSPPSDVLSGHVLEVNGAVPHVSRLSSTLCEVWRTGCGRGAIDGRQQCQVAAPVAHASATQRKGHQILVEPHAVV